MEVNYYEKTPLLHRNFGHRSRGPQFLMKCEFLQPAGSFKIRGISHLIKTSRIEASVKRNAEFAVVSSSGGNAGLAAAVASKIQAVPCSVVVPKSTKKRMVQKIEAAGAEVITVGSHWGEADEFLRTKLMPALREKRVEPLYVHPFDNRTIWEGHSSIIDEVVDQLAAKSISVGRIKAIVCSVGGGGLFSGIIKGLERHGLARHIPVIAVETKGCDVLSKSLEAGHPITLTQITSVATSLGSPYISDFAFEAAQKYGTKSIVLNDAEVLSTCIKFADDYHIVVEPACGASLHLCYNPEILSASLGYELDENDIIITIACGGSCSSYQELISTLNALQNE
ncbi:LAFE_0G18998g1_1 [Lachancea fermentati]|uniref:L-serine ammonia-lyase n=1 Tax=Lachancea fermentati TaxID=4955 RepID=A0A1G4MIZ1_LACFM|nr:LAFE_0G18998g1_1 [Lachancea fermentati]